jgi:hypothetical protein
MTIEAAQTLLKGAGYSADAYDLKLHAVALTRACHEAYAV